MITLNQTQKDIIAQFSNEISSSSIVDVMSGELEFSALPEVQQLAFLKAANACYRDTGERLVDDTVYDNFELLFKEHNAQGEFHPFLTSVGAESLAEGKTVLLPKRMMSTNKAYTEKEINKWLDNVKKAALELGLAEDDIVIRATPKLDGFAAFDDGEKLYTRGDGIRGRDISFVFERGLQVGKSNQRGQEQGEIVISKSYFEANLAEHFENSRNIQASIIAEKNIDERVQKAIDDGAAVFYPFIELDNWEGTIAALKADFDSITDSVLTHCDYDVDGVILECKNETVKEKMGATRKFHRWQIALKSNDEKAEVKVLEVIPQTSRNGKLTPVLRLEPTRLSGAEISRVTAHHYGMVKERGIGKGTVIELVRSGLVIPKIERVIEPAVSEIPTHCPCCQSEVQWIDDNLFCLNSTECSDQIEKTMGYFFEILGNNDGFGSATITTLFEHGIRSISDIYALENAPQQLADMGYKEKTVSNLVEALTKSRSVQVEDWRFLAAFGVNRLGTGIAESLLQHHPIETIHTLTADQLVAIDGFAEKSANLIVDGLASIKDEFEKIFALGFNLEITPNINDSDAMASPIAGKIVVFTGSMQQGSRGDMEKQAKSLGAKVAKSVSGKTNYLVTGEKVGANKIAAAESKGVTVITEADYLTLINE